MSDTCEKCDEPLTTLLGAIPKCSSQSLREGVSGKEGEIIGQVKEDFIN